MFPAVVLVLSILCTGCKKSPVRLLAAAFAKCQSIEAGYYEMDKTLASTSVKNGIELTQNTHFKKMETDTVYGFVFHSRTAVDSLRRFNVLYTGDDLIVHRDTTGYIHPESEIGIAFNNPVLGLYWPVAHDSCHPIPSIEALFFGILKATFTGMEEINGEECYHISVEINPKYRKRMAPTIAMENEFWINKTNFIPVQYSIRQTIEKDGDTLVLYEKCTLTKYEFGDVEDEDIFTTRSLSSDFVLKTPPLTGKTQMDIRDTAPDFQSETLSGEPFRLSDQRGQMILLCFFNASGAESIDNMQYIEALHEKYSDRGLRVVNINSAFYEREKIADFIERYEIESTVLVGSRDITTRCKVNTYPTIYLIDRDGNIAYSRIGGLNKERNGELEQVIGWSI